jgi:hypothetical protein
MRVWTVRVKPPAGSATPRAVLLRDGFSAAALLLPVAWFAGRGCLALAALHLAAIALLWALLPAAAFGIALAGLQLFMGFEARNLQGWWLGLRGFRTEAVVMARNEDAAFLNLASFRPDLARAAS